MANNTEEVKKLDREIAMLEKKLGIKNNSKKRQKVNQAIEDEGFGKGFMDFLDQLDGKIAVDPKQYKPQEYEFSDGEGPEENELMIGGGGSDSDQDGFEDFSEEETKGKKRNMKQQLKKS